MELSKNAKRKQAIVEKMARSSGKLRVLFVVLLVLFCIWSLAVICLSVAGGAMLQADTALGAVSNALSALASAVILFTISRMFRDISQQRSPFTDEQSRRLLAIGVLTLACVVFELVLTIVNPPSVAVTDTVVAGAASVQSVSVVHIDGPLFVVSILCFCLSYVFRYGALLQWLADETL